MAGQGEGARARWVLEGAEPWERGRGVTTSHLTHQCFDFRKSCSFTGRFLVRKKLGSPLCWPWATGAVMIYESLPF